LGILGVEKYREEGVEENRQKRIEKKELFSGGAAVHDGRPPRRHRRPPPATPFSIGEDETEKEREQRERREHERKRENGMVRMRRKWVLHPFIPTHVTTGSTQPSPYPLGLVNRPSFSPIRFFRLLFNTP